MIVNARSDSQSIGFQKGNSLKRKRQVKDTLILCLLSIVALSFVQTSAPISRSLFTDQFDPRTDEYKKDEIEAVFIPDPRGMLYCKENSFVASRSQDRVEKTSQNSRDFSLTLNDFRSFHSRKCSTVQDLLNAVKYGERKWEDKAIASLPLASRAEHPSYFVPYKCDIPALSSEMMCSIMNRYSHVIFQGDSLQRHTMQAMFAGLRNDLVRGGMFRYPAYGNESKKCECDGQFSEHDDCRSNGISFMKAKPWQMNLCPHLKPEHKQFELNFVRGGHWDYGDKPFAFDGIDCSREDNRGVLLFMNGGIHHDYNYTSMFQQMIQPLFVQKQSGLCNARNKLTIVWSGGQTHSPILDGAYPSQSLSNVLDYNTAAEHGLAALKKQHEIHDIHIMDWTNFTVGAQQSDGLHLLLESNLFKVYYFLNAVDLMNKEGGSDASLTT